MLIVLMLEDVRNAYAGGPGEMHRAYDLLRETMARATEINDKLLEEAAVDTRHIVNQEGQA